MVDFPLRSVDKEVHQLKLTTIITERGGVGGCSRNLCNPHSNLSGMFTGILQYLSTFMKSIGTHIVYLFICYITDFFLVYIIK